jgi:methyl-accepting chemotaxis protein/sigma-B regulation protein RsbU (phosphoserine phosphatase)
MKRWLKKLLTPPALRLNRMVVCEVVLLLTVSLSVVFFFAHKALRQESMYNARETLEGTVQQIDNVLLNVEQSAGNIYYEMLAHLDRPDRMEQYCRELLACNPYVSGCAIAFKPYYYPGRELFITYVHRKGHSWTVNGPSDLVTLDRFGNRPYTTQVWYTEPMRTGRVIWTDPLAEEEDEGATLSLCIPIEDHEKKVVGVMAVDLPVSLLSKIVMDAKISPNSYSVLLARNGSYIVHPNPVKLLNETVYTQTEGGANPTVRAAAEAMMAGETGYKPFEMDGQEWYVFYKPFQREEVPGRSNEKLDWSVGIVYPRADVYGDYNVLVFYVLVIALAGLLVFYASSRFVTRRQLKPLKQLMHSAERIAEGHYDEPIPATKRQDEIGALQTHFRKMQQAMVARTEELEEMNATLHAREAELQKLSGHTQQSDKVKSAFLHYVSRQMVGPGDVIDRSVAHLSSRFRTMTMEEIENEIRQIKEQSETILTLLSEIIHVAQIEAEKEESHE